MTGAEAALAVACVTIVVASNLLVMWMAMRWTREATLAPLLADALDRLQESIGTIHSYQVAVNAERLPSAGRPAHDVAPVRAPSMGEVRLPPEAMNPDGTVNQEALDRWMAENQATEIELPIDLEGAHE